MTLLQERLFAMQDKQHAAFQAKLTPGVEQHRLAPWTHNKTIQKAIESYRITPEQKEYLQTLKLNNYDTRYFYILRLYRWLM
uniref:hypothetical protein n=1 Tax=Prevotella sp. TaxID=59823 RepID=UPI004024C7F3